MSFTHKYKPKKTTDIVGQDLQIKDIKKRLDEHSKSKKHKALLIYGPSGTGKTSAMHALADELDLEIIEVNASDTRNADGLEQKILPAIRQQSLFSRGKIILIDEVDGLSGNSDRGGIPTLIKFIEESRYPIILTANDPWDSKFSALRQKSVMIEFKAINFLDTLKHLKEICKKEGIEFDEDALTNLGRKSGGDLRSALNDLENVSAGRKKITKKDVEEGSDREKEETIINALLKVFKTTNPEIALRAYDNVDEDVDKIFLWLDENLPNEYTSVEDRANAYENLSLADVYFGRIRRWQYYRFYVYIYDLLSAGVALSKKKKNPDFIAYKPTSRILKIWMANQKNAKKKAIATKMAAKMHTSTKVILGQMPYILAMMKDKKTLKKITEEYELGEEEIEWIKKKTV
jgi:replication factor C large subunit